MSIRFVRAALDGVAHVGRIDGDTVAFFEHDDPLAAIRGEGTVVSIVPLNGLELLAPVEEAIGPIAWTPFADGVRQTIDAQRAAPG